MADGLDTTATSAASSAPPGGLDEGRRRVHAWSLATGAALFALAVVLPLLRQQGTRSWNSLNGEDGFLLYQQAADHGGVHVLFREFQGYLQLPARILALPMEWLPVRALAPYAAVAGAVTTALLALFVFHASRRWISSTPVRLALAAIVVFMPTGGTEATGNLTNTIWTFAAVTPWALVSLDERPADVATRSVVAFLGATATAVTLVFLPLALGWALVRRTRAAVVVSSLFGFGALLQLLTMHTASTPLNSIPAERPLGEMIEMVGVRVFTTHVGGPEAAARLWDSFGTTSGVVAVIALTGLFVVALVGAERRAQLLGATFFAYSVVAMTALVWARGTAWLKAGLLVFSPLQHVRYNIVSTVLLASAFAVVIACYGAARGRVVARVGRPLFVAHAVVLILVTFTVTDYRSTAPPWSRAVSVATRTCDRLGPDATVEINQDALGWQRVRVACSDLRD